jgi:hypothetical protein
MRVAAARDNLKRFLRITGASTSVIAEVDGIFDQWGEINYFRDCIAHHATGHPDKDGSLWVQVLAREATGNEVLHFTPEILDNMAYDMWRIGQRLDCALEAPTENELAENPALRVHMNVVRGPWRYKPSQLKRTGPRHDSSLRRRAPPPRSSKG